MNFKFPKIKSKLLRKTLGVFFLIMGILGLFLPILQGILFILIGLSLLGNKKIEIALKKFLKKIKKKKRPSQKTL